MGRGGPSALGRPPAWGQGRGNRSGDPRGLNGGARHAPSRSATAKVLSNEHHSSRRGSASHSALLAKTDFGNSPSGIAATNRPLRERWRRSSVPPRRPAENTQDLAAAYGSTFALTLTNPSTILSFASSQKRGFSGRPATRACREFQKRPFLGRRRTRALARKLQELDTPRDVLPFLSALV